MNKDSSRHASSVGVKSVPCPTCRCACSFHVSNPFRPFCSDRCKGLDFGDWAAEAFRVHSEKFEPIVPEKVNEY